MQNYPLIQVLERIFCWFQANKPNITESLQPGLTREQIDAQVQALPFRLPEEVYQLYQWRNGSLITAPVEFMPQYRLLSLEDAIAERKFSYDIYLEVRGDEVRDSDDNGCWLPLFAEDGNYYVVKGDANPQANAPILHRSEIACDREDLALIFNNLTDMMQAIAECFETGVYYFDNFGSNRTWHDLDDPREAQIWLKYQSIYTNNITAILNNQSQDLSYKELIEAYGNLVRTEHPQALSVLSQALKNSDLTNSSLRFHLINDISRINNHEAIHYLLDLLKHGDSDIRRNVVSSLIYNVRDKELIQDSEAVDAVIEMLQRSGGMDEKIIKLSGILGDTRAVDPLLAILQKEVFGSSNPNEQIISLTMIEWLNPKACNLEILFAVIESLGMLKDVRAIEPLFQVAQLAQQCESQTICFVAAKALRKLGDFRAREIFTQLAYSEHAAIRDWVKTELEQCHEICTPLLSNFKMQFYDYIDNKNRYKIESILQAE